MTDKILKTKTESIDLQTIPIALGIETAGGIFSTVVEQNAMLPAHRNHVFSTVVDDQSGIIVRIFEGERPMAANNYLLGSLHLGGIKTGPRGKAKIKVSFDVDTKGIINASAKDEATGAVAITTIEAGKSLRKPLATSLVEDSLFNADYDRQLKAEANTRNEAEQSCYVIERKLLQGRNKIRENVRSRAQSSISLLRNLLEHGAARSVLKKANLKLRALQGMIELDMGD